MSPIENSLPPRYARLASVSSAILKTSIACLIAASTAGMSRLSAGVRISCQKMVVIGAATVLVVQSIHFSSP